MRGVEINVRSQPLICHIFQKGSKWIYDTDPLTFLSIKSNVENQMGISGIRTHFAIPNNIASAEGFKDNKQRHTQDIV